MKTRKLKNLETRKLENLENSKFACQQLGPFSWVMELGPFSFGRGTIQWMACQMDMDIGELPRVGSDSEDEAEAPVHLGRGLVAAGF